MKVPKQDVRQIGLVLAAGTAVGLVSVSFWTAITDYFKAKRTVLLVTVRTDPPRTVP